MPGPGRRVGATVAALVAAIALCAAHTTAAAQADPAKRAARRVVVLNSADPFLPAFVALDGAMRRAILERTAEPPELYLESLDMLRFPRTLIDGDLSALLRHKYRGLDVDVVVAAGTPALDFAVSNGAQIWPGAAIVFHSVPADVLQSRDLGPRTIGVPTELDLGPTIDLALRIRPATRRIAIVAGTAEPDRGHLSRARAALRRYGGKLDVYDMAGLARPATIAAVRALPADTVVLYLTMFRDGDGLPLVPGEVLAEIAAASSAPVFGAFETYVGDGLVAGAIVSYGSQGRRAGELVARVLNGEDPAVIGTQAPVPAGCIADWRQLRRWDVDEALLPRDCDVRFREITTWERYRWQILLALGVILAQAALIAAMFVQWRLRRSAELAAQRHRNELFHATRLATLGELTASIAHEVNQPLSAILANVDAAEMLLDSDNVRADDLRGILADVRRDDLRASEVIRRLRELFAKQASTGEQVDVHAAIAEVLRLLETESRRRGVQIEAECDAALPRVQGDHVQLQQVVLNLVVNAIDAMEQAAGRRKRVLVRTRRTGDGGVEVSVSDHGPGISEEQRKRIFESFFTTKPRGMGLGLSIARTIVEAHGGRIWAESDGHSGTTVRFALPGAAAPAA